MENRHSRREFIRMISMGALAGLSLGSLSCTRAGVEEFLQKHFREMTENEKKQVIRRLEEQYARKYRSAHSLPTKGFFGDTVSIFPGVSVADDVCTPV
jgi:hypothetical protein